MHVTHLSIDENNKAFSSINIFDTLPALLIVINALYHKVYPPAVLNIIWVIIGLATLGKILRKNTGLLIIL